MVGRSDYRNKVTLNTPLEPDEGSTPFGDKQVLQLDDFRVRFGRPRFAVQKCLHRKLDYNIDERRVWCEDCESTLDNFTAFMIFVDIWADIVKDIERCRSEVRDAMEHSLISRAAKHIDQFYRKRNLAPCCPHCQTALLPEDILNISRSVSKELEEQRRKAKAEGDTE